MPPQPSSSSSSSNGATTSVQVALRIRPTTTQDTSSIPARFQRTVIHAISPTTVAVDAGSSAPGSIGSSAAAAALTSASASKRQTFTFDQVHPPSASQHDLFVSTAQPLISRFVEGFNCTILAYGQTSSGKTFTMTGIDIDADPTDPTNGMGIIPRAVYTIFSRCRDIKEQRGNAWSYTLKGSFIEIYNEDLIDLLSLDDGGGKRDVQIREDKQGHIIWEGLREVTVKNPNEVLNLIRQGTAIRRTNETDMNAQSSRSHAIFSLTLTQKKFTGSSAPPRSSSPLPPGGRSPSRIGRPGSTFGAPPSAGRVSSPTFGRSGTPTFTSAIARGGRPASSLGFLSPDASRGHGGADDEHGEWVTVVSKFHFVDLAGSERLKRTAAAGERIKEGISINSGLLALGNVISALGDPARAKAHTASYIPYRDSKLTRLLQDSLGGNAHTLMIACVSPTEWNTGETVNTLKYANRARNIKNRVVVNEKEEGWDDIEWLQGMVTRLRRDMKTLKEGGAVAATGAPREAVVEGAGKRVLAQMSELQNNYEDLREKFVQRTEELTRLRRELADQQRNSKGGHIGGTAKYEEIVGPVIEEYEKTISAIEAELNLNRAALRHTNELFEEKETEYMELSERHATTELYLEELKSRVAKLSEREASTEAYIRDLEEKVKQFDESVVSSSGSITDLKREITRYKDTESHSSQYIADLETRLARADESVLALRDTVEKLEAECERRKSEAEVLQSRLESLKKDGESWRTDLEEREQKVQALELKMEQWEAKRKEAAEERERLGGLVHEVAKARQNLEIAAPSVSGGSSRTPSISEVSLNEPSSAAESQLLALQEIHTATLADLSSVTAKYRDALAEIADLAAQLQEAKVNPPPSVSGSPERSTDSPRRRMTRGMSKDGLDVQTNGNGRRLFFRQAASAESLHSRSLSQSLSLSQELSSARSRKASISSHGTSSSISLNSPYPRPRSSTSASSPHTPTNERSVSSLEKEIMRLQEVLKEREAEISVLEESLRENNRGVSALPTPLTSPTTPDNGNGDVSPDAHLSPKTLNSFSELRGALDSHEASNDAVSDVDENLERLNELMRSMAQKESTHREHVDKLTTELNSVRRQYDELTVLSRNQTENMSAELEAFRKNHEEDLVKHQTDMLKLEEAQEHEAKLIETMAQMQLRESELTESLQKAEAEHASTVQRLKSEHEEAMRAKEAEVDGLLTRLKQEHESALGDLRTQLTEASAALDKAHEEHRAAFGKLQADHEEELRRRSEAVGEMLEHSRVEHEGELAKVSADHAAALKQVEDDAAANLQRTEEEYYNALTKLREDHAQALEKQTLEAATALERLRDDHAREMKMAEISREGSVSESQSERELALKELQDAHAADIAVKERQFNEDLQKLKDEHAQLLATKEDQHRESQLRMQARHAETLTNKEIAFSDELERMQNEHTRALAAKDQEHQAALAKLAEEHAAQTSTLQSESAEEISRLAAALEDTKRELTASSSDLREHQEAELNAVKEQQAAILQEIGQRHEEELAHLKEQHDAALAAAASTAEEERTSLLASHTEELLKLRTEHQQALGELQAELIAAQEQHRQDLEEAHAQTERLLAEEKERLAEAIAEADKTHAEEIDTLQKAQDLRLRELREDFEQERAQLLEERQLLLDELDAHKSASDEHVSAQEEIRAKHEEVLQEKDSIIESMRHELTGSQQEREDLAIQVAMLKAELASTRDRTTELVKEASKRESLVEELEKHRSVLADMQEALQRTKDEMDNLQAEKMRQDSLLRDLQTQQQVPSSPILDSPPRSNASSMAFSRSNGSSGMKIPPPTPPPTVPIPPAPKMPSLHEQQASTGSSAGITLTSQDAPSTPATSVANSPILGSSDSKTLAQLQQQAKHIEEQEVMIKTLNKQLTHCESDLQAHIDLVATLESSLGDSEKNLRKARMQATELARERDNLNSQITSLRAELHDAKSEVVNVRRSIVEEKQSLESKLDEERRAKERARAQLDSRMDELQRRKSKFACL